VRESEQVHTASSQKVLKRGSLLCAATPQSSSIADTNISRDMAHQETCANTPFKKTLMSTWEWAQLNGMEFWWRLPEVLRQKDREEAIKKNPEVPIKDHGKHSKQNTFFKTRFANSFLNPTKQDFYRPTLIMKTTTFSPAWHTSDSRGLQLFPKALLLQIST